MVDVFDDDSAATAIVPIDLAGLAADLGLRVSEGASPSGTALPYRDAYQVLLTRAPAAGSVVQITVTADNQTQITTDPANAGWGASLTLTFTRAADGSGNWATAQTVYVRATQDTAREGLHFSRITNVLVSDLAAFLGLRTEDVAKGLMDAIKGDVVGRYTATVNGSTVNVTGRTAFTAETTGGLTIDSGGSTFAYIGTVGAAIAPGAVEHRRPLEDHARGRRVHLRGRPGDDRVAVAAGLAGKINDGRVFTRDGRGRALDDQAHRPRGGLARPGAVRRADDRRHADRRAQHDPLRRARRDRRRRPARSRPARRGGSAWTWRPRRAGPSSSTSPAATARARRPARSTPRSPTTTRPACSILETGGGTNVTEPSRFIVLGDGFVTAVLNAQRFYGDFGTAIVNEVEGHNTRTNPMNLDLARWTTNANPDIANLFGGPMLEPHITVRGNGNGYSDFYRFTVSTAGARASFDIDRGYAAGDPILWLSLLKLYDAQGNLLAQGTGYSNPGLRRGRLEHVARRLPRVHVRQPGRVRARGQLVAVLHRPADRRRLRPADLARGPRGGRLHVRAVTGARGREPAAATATRSRSSSPTSSPSTTSWSATSGRGGVIDWMTPYARIQGSGNGTYDLFSFQVTADMLNPQSLTDLTALNGSTYDTSTFFSSAALRLNGRVTAGDVWKLTRPLPRLHVHRAGRRHAVRRRRGPAERAAGRRPLRGLGRRRAADDQRPAGLQPRRALAGRQRAPAP